ncbi:MAG: hypothetical protein ACPGYT_02580 [Nitrospirales bacterium]
MKIAFVVTISISLLFVAMQTFDVEAKAEAEFIQFVAQKSQQRLKPCTKRNQQNCQRRKTRRSAPANILQSKPTSMTQNNSSATQQGTHTQTGTYSAGELRGGGCWQQPSDPPNRWRFADPKVFLTTDDGLDFGGKGFAVTSPTTSGQLNWQFRCGEMSADLEGYLHLKGMDGFCSRMRMDFRTHAHTLLTTKYSNQHCPQDNQHHVWPVDINFVTSPNHFSSDKLNEVKISIERLDASGLWKAVRSEVFVLPTIQKDVYIVADGFDFGGKAFFAGGPTNTGDATFIWSGGKVTPRVTGTLYINNAAGACARMKIEYYQDDSIGIEKWVKSKYGGKVCAINGNKLHKWSVDLSPYGHDKLSRIKVAIETLATDGKWSKVKEDSVHFLRVPGRS